MPEMAAGIATLNVCIVSNVTLIRNINAEHSCDSESLIYYYVVVRFQELLSATVFTVLGSGLYTWAHTDTDKGFTAMFFFHDANKASINFPENFSSMSLVNTKMKKKLWKQCLARSCEESLPSLQKSASLSILLK